MEVACVVVGADVSTSWAVISELASPLNGAAVKNGLDSDTTPSLCQDVLGKGDVVDAYQACIVDGSPLHAGEVSQ